jgi:D-methionine transport system substrate-binding protein
MIIFYRRRRIMKRKKFLALAGSIVLGVSTLAGCGSTSSTSSSTSSENTANEAATESTVAATEEATTQEATTEEATTEASTEVESKGTITVAASATPHAEILEQAAPLLAAEGWDLEVTVFDDYVQPNLVVDSGEFDANYFQHIPYLNNFNEERGTDLVNAGGIHYEPFGIYPGTKDSLDDIADGDTIAVPNDTTNEARALLLLEANGIITLKDGAGLEATVKDIESYTVDVKIQELEAAQVSRVTDEVAYVVLNGNYALEAGYSVGKDALAYETSDSEAAQTYVNVIAVKSGNEDSEKIKALVEVLKSDEIKDYINETYDGAVIPFE